MGTALRDRNFKKKVLAHFTQAGRHNLPWRTDARPYAVFISEIMLQQTQVNRVIPKFTAFLEKFPSWKRLAEADLREVYALWSGLGYNRRARFLRDAAKKVIGNGGEIANDVSQLKTLPGVGPYTAGAIAAFAFGEPAPFIETNIRTAVTHQYFPNRSVVSDAEVMRVLLRHVPKRGKAARDWYAALMDYGAHLKQTGVRLNNKVKGYTKQSKFEGSLRQVRGRLMRELSEKGSTTPQLAKKLKIDATIVDEALAGLLRDNLVIKKQRMYQVAQ